MRITLADACAASRLATISAEPKPPTARVNRISLPSAETLPV